MNRAIVITIAGIPVLWLAVFLTREGLKFRNIAIIAESRHKALDRFNTIPHSQDEITSFLREWDNSEFGISYEDARDALAIQNSW